MLPRLKHAATAAQQEARFAMLALSSASGSAPFDAALARYVEFLVADGELDVDLEVDPGVTLAPDEEIEVFRIVQEGLANVRKHAGARMPSSRSSSANGRRVVTRLRRRRRPRGRRPGRRPGAEEHEGSRGLDRRSAVPPLLARAGNGDRGRPAGGLASRRLCSGEPDRRQSRIGRRLRVEQVRELADAVREARRRPGVVGVAVDDDRRAGGARAPRHAPAASSASKPHGPSDEQLRLERQHLVPGRRVRRLARLARARRRRRRARSSPAASGRRRTAARSTRRRTPAAAGSPRTDAAAVSIVASHPRRDLLAALARRRAAPASSADRVRDLAERARIEREHLGADRAGRRELAARDGADRAQVLRHDQVRRELLDQAPRRPCTASAPSRTDARTASSISRLDSSDGVDPRRRHDRLADHLGGQRHSSETPTSESISPSSAMISVALGRNEQIRTPPTIPPSLCHTCAFVRLVKRPSRADVLPLPQRDDPDEVPAPAGDRVSGLRGDRRRRQRVIGRIDLENRYRYSVACAAEVGPPRARRHCRRPLVAWA